MEDEEPESSGPGFARFYEWALFTLPAHNFVLFGIIAILFGVSMEKPWPVPAAGAMMVAAGLALVWARLRGA